MEPILNDLKCLETFVWVARLGGFRAAAAHLNTTQPSVSARIDQLEQHFGVVLFGPPLKRTTLTREGVVLLDYAERILSTMTEARTVVAQGDAVRGVLKIGVAETIVHSLLPQLISVINANYPDLVVDMIVDTSDILSRHVLAGSIDVGMQLGLVADPRAVNQNLCQLGLGWFASTDLPLGTDVPTLQEVARWPVITFAHGTPLGEEVKRALSIEGSDQLRLWGSSSLTIMIRMALDGLGSCILPHALIRSELAEGKLRRLEVEGVALPSGDFYASYLRKPDNFLAALIARHGCEIGHSLTNDARPKSDQKNLST